MLFLLSGCWDSINLEDRGFVVGTIIDLEDSSGTYPVFKVTNQFVIPSGVGSPVAEQGGGSGTAFINLTESGTSIHRVNNRISAKTSKSPFYEHLSVLIVSERIAQKKHLLTNLLDTYIRNVNLRRGVKVIVAKGKPEKLFEFKTPEDKLSAVHIDQLLEKTNKERGFFEATTIGNLEEYHLRGNSYVLPLLEVTDEIEYQAGAVFNGPEDKMVGTFNLEEMRGLELIDGVSEGKVSEFTYKDHKFAYEIIRMDSNISVDVQNINEINVTIDIELDGEIKEAYGAEDFFKTGEIDALQNAIAQNIEKTIESTIQKAQQELNTDVFKVWQQLETKHYDKWQQIKDSWEEGKNYFSEVAFDINVGADIHSIGTTNKSR